jgi:hypothetical protein
MALRSSRDRDKGVLTSPEMESPGPEFDVDLASGPQERSRKTEARTHNPVIVTFKRFFSWELDFKFLTP